MATVPRQNGVSQQIRRRQACDMCYKKKTKCDAAKPKCSQCVDRNWTCTFTPIIKDRVALHRKGKRFVELESRLKEIEAQLGITSQKDKSDASIAASIPLQRKNNPSAPLTSPESGSSPMMQVPARSEGNNEVATSPNLADSGNAWQFDPLGSPAARLGRQSSPVYSQFIPQSQYNVILGSINDSIGIPPPVSVSWSLDIPSTSQGFPFPDLPEMISLVQDYFTHFNSVFPIFHKESFLRHLSEDYSSFLIEGSSGWASLSVILSISLRFRAMAVSDPREEDIKAWAYLRNAMSIISQLSLQNSDLASVQTLLGIVVVLQGTPNPKPANILIATVARLAQSICLHNREYDHQFDEIELHQRRRVFWLIYILDKDISLRVGHPSIINDDDVELELPDPDPADRIGFLVDGTCVVNVFSIRVRLAIIQSKSYARLYSAKALRDSAEDREQAIRELDAELLVWNHSLPSKFRPTHSIKALNKYSILHIMILQLTYFNCLCMVHRMSCRFNNWLDEVLDYGLNESSSDSLARCVSAARSSIRFIKLTPQGNFAGIWAIYHNLCISIIIVLGSIPQNARSPKGRADLNLLMPLLLMLNKLASDTQQPELLNISQFCNKLAERARNTLDAAEGHSRRTVEVPLSHNTLNDVQNLES